MSKNDKPEIKRRLFKGTGDANTSIDRPTDLATPSIHINDLNVCLHWTVVIIIFHSTFPNCINYTHIFQTHFSFVVILHFLFLFKGGAYFQTNCYCHGTTSIILRLTPFMAPRQGRGDVRQTAQKKIRKRQ